MRQWIVVFSDTTPDRHVFARHVLDAVQDGMKESNYRLMNVSSVRELFSGDEGWKATEYRVTVKHTITRTFIVNVEAEDESDAEQKVQEMLDASEVDLDAEAAHNVEDDDPVVDSVEEV